jgi:hypothetical protein
MTRINKFLFQVAFIFLLLLTLPIDPWYYKKLSANADGFHFQGLFQLLDYVPFLGYPTGWGLHSFAGWCWALGVAIIMAVPWYLLDNTFHARYERWQDLLRIILRYRLAIAMFTYGFVLLFPLQVPYPSLSDLHTKYGEFLPWKIYYHSLGVATAGYEPILGLVEVSTGILLLWRRTTVIGAGLAAALLVNIVLVNFAYDLGSHVLSVYLLLISIVLLLHDTPRLYLLLVKERTAPADHYSPAFTGRLHLLRRWVKPLFFLFFLLYGILAYSNYKNDRWPYPAEKGISGAAGFYNVHRFVLDTQELPYSLTDTLRWQNVVFEEWNTLSVRLNRRITPDLKGPFINARQDYESEGNGGRTFYSYTVKDSLLLLTNKNDYKDTCRFLFRQSADSITLDGADSNNRNLHIELSRIDKKYLLRLGRRKPVSVY